MSAQRKWAARCWHWRKDADPSADEDLAVQQEEKWCDAPSKALAHAVGRRLAAHERAPSPGLYDVMVGTPDACELDGHRWDVDEEVRP